MSDAVCPHCKVTVQVNPSLSGQQVSCPHCAGIFVMPSQNPFDFAKDARKQVSSVASRMRKQTGVNPVIFLAIGAPALFLFSSCMCCGFCALIGGSGDQAGDIASAEEEESEESDDSESSTISSVDEVLESFDGQWRPLGEQNRIRIQLTGSRKFININGSDELLEVEEVYPSQQAVAAKMRRLDTHFIFQQLEPNDGTRWMELSYIAGEDEIKTTCEFIAE